MSRKDCSIGPLHTSLPGPMHMVLKLHGEIIDACQVETGFLHRGLEKQCELHSWHAALFYADHLDPEGAVFSELVLCLAVEEIAGIMVPERAQSIRLVLVELGRISSHLAFMARMARSVGSETIVHYVLRDRERILDLFELLTGARVSLNFLRYGGVKGDVTDGFIERVLDVCDLIRFRMKEYNDIFTFNAIFLKRTLGVAPLSVELIEQAGITGPNARASGVREDSRKGSPLYQALEFDIPSGKSEDFFAQGWRGLLARTSKGCVGDVHDRFLVRLREMTQSIEILRQLVAQMPLGVYQNTSIHIDRNYPIPPGESYQRMESARGRLGCHVVSDGQNFPGRIQFSTPTRASLWALPQLVRGIRIEDLPVVLASLDLSIAEADR